jgi:hypothetical protein
MPLPSGTTQTTPGEKSTKRSGNKENGYGGEYAMNPKQLLFMD